VPVVDGLISSHFWDFGGALGRPLAMPFLVLATACPGNRPVISKFGRLARLKGCP
jgi:hypothetical protein